MQTTRLETGSGFKLGDLDSNQEWRIQSPLFCQLNYLPPIDHNANIDSAIIQDLRCNHR